MEDIKRRLEFDNPSIQTQAVWRLYSDVRKKKPDDKPINDSTIEFLELKTLWEYSCSQHIVPSRACARALVQLVVEGDADFNYVLNGFLNLVPSAKTLQGLVEGVSGLLQLQVKLLVKEGETSMCPYGTRSSPHPFISILTNRPAHAWPLLAEEVTLFFTDQKLSRHALAALDPFLKFVLLEPARSEEYKSLRNFLQNALCDLVFRLSLAKDIQRVAQDYIVRLLPATQISTMDSLAETARWCDAILLMMTSRPDMVSPSAGKCVVTFTLSLCQKCSKGGIGFSSLCRQVIELGRLIPEVLMDDVNVVILAQLLLESTELDAPAILTIALLILENKPTFSCLTAGMLFLPVLQILSTPNSPETYHVHTILTALASKVMVKLSTYQPDLRIMTNVPEKSRQQMTPEGYVSSTFVQLAQRLTEDPLLLKEWMNNLQAHIVKGGDRLNHLTALVTSVLLTSDDVALCMAATDRLVDIAKAQKEQAVTLLPVILNALGTKLCPTLKLHLLETIPKLATHKLCVGPVLKTIQSLALSPKLKPISVRLLTELWKYQDRIFPHLLAAITDPGTLQTTLTSTVDDLVLAKASAIRDVCKHRPEQHGGDMLKPLSNMLDACSDERGAPAAALSLEALYHLCEAEVIDIMSAWSVLDTKLSKETRPLIVEQICDLFSLVPQLEVKTEDYETFQAQIVRRLWLYTQTDTERVCNAAYQALSAFHQGCFKISHFRHQVVDDFVEKAESIIKQQEQVKDTAAMTVDDVFNPVPGICFTRQLKRVSDASLEGYEALLCSLVGKEVENLPRGIYYSSLRQRPSANNRSKALGSIPAFILNHYEKTRQPVLGPGLAAGLLFCYDPLPPEMTREGRSRRHHVITRGKAFQQTFKSLLSDVPVDPWNSYRSMLMPQAWVAFTERLFNALLESRKAEIDLQLQREHIEELEASTQKQLAWLWVRERLVDVIKGSSRGNPATQSNCILALAGLTACIHGYATGLDAEGVTTDTDLTEYRSHTHWLNIVMESLMSIVDFTYPVKSSLLGLCQQRSVEDRLPASVLAQAAGFLALAELSPILINVNVDLIYDALVMATGKLPGKMNSDALPGVVQSSLGLGLGIFLARLTEECFTDISGRKGKTAVMMALDSLEESSLCDADNRPGSLLGLGLAISALSHDGKTDSRVHVAAIHGQLLDLLKTPPSSQPTLQALTVCLSCITGVGFTCNILDVDRVKQTLALMSEVQQNSKCAADVSIALGILYDSLHTAGMVALDKLRQQLYLDWTNTLSNEESSLEDKQSALSGLFGLVGCGRPLLPLQGEPIATASGAEIDTVIDLARKAVVSGTASRYHSEAAWMIGHLYMSTCTVTENRASVPQNYNYLPESSVLRASTEFLLEAGKSGPESVSYKQVNVVLTSLMEEVTQPLPPVNWAAILSPLMRLNFGEKVACSCLQVALQQCTSSPTAALFLSSWIVPPLFNTLPVDAKVILCKSIPSFLKTVSATVLQTFLDNCCKDMFSGANKNKKQCLAFFTGLHATLAIPDPPEAVCKGLYQTTLELFHVLKGEQDTHLLAGLSACVSCLPDRIFDQLTDGDCIDPLTIDRGTFVRCYAVANGHQPIALLNSCIDAAFHNPDSDCSRVLSMLLHCFKKQTAVTSASTGVLNRVKWMLEILGHVRNMITTSTPLWTTDAHAVKTTGLAIDTIAGAISLWTNPWTAGLYGLTGDLLTLPDDTSKSSASLPIPVVQPGSLLAATIPGLTKEPWSQIIAKVIDWLVMMDQHGHSHLSPDTRQHLQDALLILRDSRDFHKAVVWCSVYDRMI